MGKKWAKKNITILFGAKENETEEVLKRHKKACIKALKEWRGEDGDVYLADLDLFASESVFF